jgi:anaerobic selenocysteine-containing dehydrogenase
MCHESTSVALAESIGIGKASVALSDVYNAELTILAGQNPGHQPRPDAERARDREAQGSPDALDEQATGPQFITVENSMCSVHASRGPLPPASSLLRSEVSIVTSIAQATLDNRYGIDWAAMRDDYAVIRGHISRRARLRELRGRRGEAGRLRHAPPATDSRRFDTPSGRAEFAASTREAPQIPPGHLVLQTLRSHDQDNTTVYGLSDRYRGIEGARRVVLVNPADIAQVGFEDGDIVDLITHWPGDQHVRRAPSFRIVGYQTPRGSSAAYCRRRIC